LKVVVRTSRRDCENLLWIGDASFTFNRVATRPKSIGALRKVVREFREKPDENRMVRKK